MSGEVTALDAARQVLAWLRGRGEPVVALRDLHRSLQGRAWVESADTVRAALAVLVEHGYARPLPDQRQPGQSGRPSERYALIDKGELTALDAWVDQVCPSCWLRLTHG